MNITLTGRQFEVTSTIREYAEGKINAVLADKSLNVTSVSMVMDREKSLFTADLVVNCKYHVIEAKGSDFDLYKAIDAAASKVDVQLTRLREKIRDHQAAPMRDAEASSGSAEK